MRSKHTNLKFSERALNSENIITKSKIKKLLKSDCRIVKKMELKNTSDPVFSIIILIFNGNIEFIKESFYSAKKQTYANTEIIIIDHASSGEVKSFIEKECISDLQITLIRFDTNYYDERKNPIASIVMLWDAGLFTAKGKYISILSYDDKISNNYVELMIELFKNNPECVSASPRVVSINEYSNLNEDVTESLDRKNRRGKYTSGIELINDIMNKGVLMNAPGELLAQHADTIISSGGFDPSNDMSQIFRFGYKGEIGYDPNATLYWRHHSNQSSKQIQKQGWISYKLYLEPINKYNIYDEYYIFIGSKFAERYKKFILEYAKDQSFELLRIAFVYSYKSGFKALLNIYRQCPINILLQAINISFLIIIKKFTKNLLRI
tara:strand:+ start:616 stop:1755 length:1140 start_codon:yes stop_codon:yes gene_type:complete